jgi:hypothetical protein
MIFYSASLFTGLRIFLYNIAAADLSAEEPITKFIKNTEGYLIFNMTV